MDSTLVTVTMFECGVCRKRYDREPLAADCCMCTDCNKRPGTVNDMHRGKLCAACAKAILLRKTREALKTAEAALAHAKEDAATRIAWAEGRVVECQQAFDAARAKEKEEPKAEAV